MAINSIGSASVADYSRSEAPKGTEDSGGEEFSGAVAAADLVVQKPGVPHPNQQVAGLSGGVQAAASGGVQAAASGGVQAAASGGVQAAASGGVQAAASEGIQAAASGKLDKAVPRNAGGSTENASLIQKMAVSSNTGVDIAGLKPWSPDWVFEGGLNKHPSQKTLIEDPARGGSAGALESLEQLLQSAGATMAGSPDGQMSAGAMQMGAVNSKVLPGAKTLGSDDFVNVRQASMMAKQAKGAIGTEQAITMPGSGLKAPNADEPAAELKDKKGRLPDTLGLIHPQSAKTEGPNFLPFAAGAQAMKMDGSVVAGSMSQNRLNSESVGGIAQSIRQLGNGGEVRIRLKPDHLGELHLKVMTGGRSGSEVGLQIHASDDRAKKILEESLGSLRESLASQNLSLAKVDVQVAQPSSSANLGSDSNQDRPGLAGQQNFSSNSGDGNRGNSAQDGSSGSETASGRSAVKATPRQAAAFGGGGSARAVASSRLDVIA
jgi:hypothetical protein